VIQRKRKGETVTVETPGEPEEEAPDLITALKASIEAHGGSRRKSTAKRETRRKSSGRRPSRRPKSRR